MNHHHHHQVGVICSSSLLFMYVNFHNFKPCERVSQKTTLCTNSSTPHGRFGALWDQDSECSSLGSEAWLSESFIKDFQYSFLLFQVLASVISCSTAISIRHHRPLSHHPQFHHNPTFQFMTSITSSIL